MEKESSKSLLSMVCDATFWLGRDGDTILNSSRELDAIFGCSVERSRLSLHTPESEIKRIRKAVSDQEQQHAVSLLPTSVLRHGDVATNVDLFIVSPRHASNSKGQSAVDSVESFGFFIGLRLAQSSAGFSEICNAVESVKLPDCEDPSMPIPCSAASAEPGAEQPQRDSAEDMHQAASGDLRDVSKDGLRPRRRVTFSDQDSISDAASSASTSVMFRNQRQAVVTNHFHGECRKGIALAAPFMPSQPYFKECVLSLLEDIAGSINYEYSACCAWHGHLHKIICFLEEMQHWRKCDEDWPEHLASWQCEHCSAIVSASQADDYCWLCSSSRSTA